MVGYAGSFKKRSLKERMLNIINKNPKLTNKQLGDILGCSTNSIRNYKKEYQVEIKGIIPERYEIYTKLDPNLSLRDLADKIGCKVSTVRYYRQLRFKWFRYFFPDLSIKELADKVGCSTEHIQKLLKSCN